MKFLCPNCQGHGKQSDLTNGVLQVVPCEACNNQEVRNINYFVYNQFLCPKAKSLVKEFKENLREDLSWTKPSLDSAFELLDLGYYFEFDDEGVATALLNIPKSKALVESGHLSLVE